MVTTKQKTQLLGYSAGFASASLLAGLTKAGLDTMVFTGAMKKGKGLGNIAAIAILIVGTMVFGKMIQKKLFNQALENNNVVDKPNQE